MLQPTHVLLHTLRAERRKDPSILPLLHAFLTPLVRAEVDDLVESCFLSHGDKGFGLECQVGKYCMTVGWTGGSQHPVNVKFYLKSPALSYALPLVLPTLESLSGCVSIAASLIGTAIRETLRAHIGGNERHAAKWVLANDPGNYFQGLKEAAQAWPKSEGLKRAYALAGRSAGFDAIEWNRHIAWLKHVSNPSQYHPPEPRLKCKFCGELDFLGDSGACGMCEEITRTGTFLEHTICTTPESIYDYATTRTHRDVAPSLKYVDRYKRNVLSED